MTAPTRAAVCHSALQICGVSDSATVGSGWEQALASETLDDILTAWENEGIRFWKRSQQPVALSSSSFVTNGGKNYECLRNHTSGATTEPGVGGLWAHYWVESTTTGTGAWAVSTSYTSAGHVVLGSTIIGVSAATYRDSTNQNDYPLSILSTPNYFDIRDKVTPDSGTPSSIHFLGKSPLEFVINPRPTNATDYTLTLSVDTRMDTGTGGGQPPDVQRNWILALKYELANYLCDPFSVPDAVAARIAARANILKSRAKGKDVRPVTNHRAKPAM